VTSDQTLRLVSASLATFVLSLFLPLVSVHTYYENRTIAGIFGVVGLTLFLFFFRNKATTTTRRVASVVGRVLCVLAVAANVAFIV
jgi:hypothetical protein